MIELVVKIPEEMYQKIKDTSMVISGRRSGRRFDYILFNSIINGTPLPKGHGDLIDRNELLDESYQIDSMYCEYDEVVNVDDIKDAPIIIEGSDSK